MIGIFQSYLRLSAIVRIYLSNVLCKIQTESGPKVKLKLKDHHDCQALSNLSTCISLSLALNHSIKNNIKVFQKSKGIVKFTTPDLCCGVNFHSGFFLKKDQFHSIVPRCLLAFASFQESQTVSCQIVLCCAASIGTIGYQNKQCQENTAGAVKHPTWVLVNISFTTFQLCIPNNKHT